MSEKTLDELLREHSEALNRPTYAAARAKSPIDNPEADPHGDRDHARDVAVALEQQVAAVAALHVATRHALNGAYCMDCFQDWPCHTRRALGGEP